MRYIPRMRTYRFLPALLLVVVSAVAAGAQQAPGTRGQYAVREPGSTVSIALQSTESGRVVITTTGSVDTVLAVYDRDRTLLAWNDDYNDLLTSQVILDIEGGQKYELAVHLYAPWATGSFGIEVSDLIDTSVDDFGGRDDPGSYTLGSTVPARMDYVGDVDAFAFVPEQTGVYRVETVGTLDTVMALLDAEGRVMFEADDTGKGLNPAIETELYAGRRYTVLVHAYDPWMTGRYELTSSLVQEGTRLQPATHSRDGDVYAVIVGAADYRGSGDLVGTLTDSYNMYRYVRYVLGAPAENVILLQDQLGRLDDTVSAGMVQDALSGLAARAGPRDQVIFYYSGHGDEREGVFYLSLPDGELSGPELAATIERIEAEKVLLIFDSCNAGGFGELLVNDRRSILSASGSDELSYVYEAGAASRTLGSVFTSWFADHLLYSGDDLTLEQAFNRTVDDLLSVQATQNPQLFTQRAEFRVR
ncbi:MAG: caspase family protein [Spirochaetaceae bacterium]|nr:MAG: caspase family protein [Spirochaetaceae bacterium]